MYGYNDIMGLSAWHLLALSAAGLVATALNTLAGGGSLISFPLLIMLGIPPIAANATNAFALTLGGVSGALSSTGSLPRIRQHLIRFAPPTFVGTFAGAWLLLSTTQALFNSIVPLLLLVATMLLGLRSVLTKPRHITSDAAHALAPLCVIAVAVYGGYFGAGMGIVFLAVLDWFSPGNLQDNNAIKNWLQCLVNVVATPIFLAKGLVLIVPGIALMAGGLVGGYVSGQLARRLDPKVLRLGVVAYGIIITCVFAARLF